MQFIWICILILTTISINFGIGHAWSWSSPEIRTVHIYNESTVNISWYYSYFETEPSFVELSVILYKLNSTDIFCNNFTMDGKDRFNFTSLMIVNNNFLNANGYYAVVLEYNTTYKYGINESTWMSGTSDFKLFKMATTPIPREDSFLDIKSNSVIVSMMWPREIPIFKLDTYVKLNDRDTTLPIETVSNGTYLISKYRFDNLLPDTNYNLTTNFTRKYLPDVLHSSRESSGIIRTLRY
ncbi:unnamed protein product [Adineta steineri]|uniref:Fibronectin type-III domain-containing protein n=3 Tax=Adineta steineri TaxID=433720 RepID=A0A819DCC2_9BILA|nr:unnamed protein product [Adineta steineri]CAF3832158.1 unnamed protein product [Adineta steineri]